MSDTKKQVKRPTLKDDALRAIERINHIVTDDLWEELARFSNGRRMIEFADLHESLQYEVDVLLLKIFRSFSIENSLLLLRSAPEAIRLAALIRLKLTVLELENIAKGAQTLNRSSAMLFFCLFSESHENLQDVFAKELVETSF